MRVWIVSVGEPLPTDGRNTRLRRMGNLAACISEEGHEVEWFSVSFDHYKKMQRCVEDRDVPVNGSYTMHLVYAGGYKNNVSLARILHHISAGRNIYRKMNSCRKPDVIIASMEPLEVSSAAVRYGIEHKVPVVADVRDLWPEIYREVLPGSVSFLITPYIKMCRASLRKTMAGAFSIIGLSDEFLKYGLSFAGRDVRPLDRVFPIAYPNYDYGKYKHEFNKNWGVYGLEADDFIIAFMGNFGKQFTFDSIIDAGRLLKNNGRIKFVLCGTGVQLDSIKKRVSDNFVFPGWIEKEQILSLAANASLGIAPYIDSMNYTMNTPNKFGEYLSAGLPVLVSVGGSMENLLRENECGLRYGDGESLAGIIEGYYDDKSKLLQHSGNARLLFEKSFNGDAAYKDMLNYLFQVKERYIKSYQ